MTDFCIKLYILQHMPINVFFSFYIFLTTHRGDENHYSPFTRKGNQGSEKLRIYPRSHSKWQSWKQNPYLSWFS